MSARRFIAASNKTQPVDYSPGRTCHHNDGMLLAFPASGTAISITRELVEIFPDLVILRKVRTKANNNTHASLPTELN